MHTFQNVVAWRISFIPANLLFGKTGDNSLYIKKLVFFPFVPKSELGVFKSQKPRVSTIYKFLGIQLYLFVVISEELSQSQGVVIHFFKWK